MNGYRSLQKKEEEEKNHFPESTCQKTWAQILNINVPKLHLYSWGQVNKAGAILLKPDFSCTVLADDTSCGYLEQVYFKCAFLVEDAFKKDLRPRPHIGSTIHQGYVWSLTLWMSYVRPSGKEWLRSVGCCCALFLGRPMWPSILFPAHKERHRSDKAKHCKILYVLEHYKFVLTC